MRVTKDLGTLLLGIWLILTGLMQILNFSIPYGSILMAGLAIAAGIIILFRR